MSLPKSFSLHPLFRALTLLSISSLLLVAEVAYARVLNPGEVVNIDSATAPDEYVLNGESTLNADGAQTRDITVNHSTLNLTGTNVQATGNHGVLLNAGRANIGNSHITSDRIGLVVSRDAAGIPHGWMSRAAITSTACSSSTASRMSPMCS